MVLALRHPPGVWGSLARLQDRFPGGVPATHAVWMWRRILEILGFVHASGLSTATSRWATCWSTRMSTWCTWSAGRRPCRSRPAAIPRQPTIARDLAQSGWAIRFLLAGPTSSPPPNDRAPAPLAELLGKVTEDPDFVRGKNARQLADEVGQAARAAFGPPRFDPFRDPRRISLTAPIDPTPKRNNGLRRLLLEAHEALIAGRADKSAAEVFSQHGCNPLMNPKGLRMRESCDSAEHPNSTPIVFALDVTGSMGHIPKMLAREQLPQFMKLLQDCQVADPQILFMAVGDATSDQAPLQIGQFESTAELMDQWLTWSYLEGGGGGGNQESYELVFYAVAQHTAIESFDKRRKKGYLFMTGDELPYPLISRHQVGSIFDEKLDEDLPIEEVIAAAAETYHLFFLIPDLGRRERCEARWRELLGDRVICLEDRRGHLSGGRLDRGAHRRQGGEPRAGGADPGRAQNQQGADRRGDAGPFALRRAAGGRQTRPAAVRRHHRRQAFVVEEPLRLRLLRAELSTRYVSVIGLFFGDCGKGRFVDELCGRLGARTVVRYNGGAQAGHNVLRADGRHHVFSSFGAGTFHPGARTLLAAPVVIHPGGLLREAEALGRRKGCPTRWRGSPIDARCRVTTPFLQAAGRLRERARPPKGRHGSCGIGFGETVRLGLEHPEASLHYAELADPRRCREKAGGAAHLLRGFLAEIHEERRPRRRMARLRRAGSWPSAG